MKLNRKGMTLTELMLSVVMLSVALVLMYGLMTNIQKKKRQVNLRSKDLVKIADIELKLQDYIMNSTEYGRIELDKIEITNQDNKEVNLVIGEYNHQITVDSGNIVYQKMNNGNIEATKEWKLEGKNCNNIHVNQNKKPLLDIIITCSAKDNEQTVEDYIKVPMLFLNAASINIVQTNSDDDPDLLGGSQGQAEIICFNKEDDGSGNQQIASCYGCSKCEGIKASGPGNYEVTCTPDFYHIQSAENPKTCTLFSVTPQIECKNPEYDFENPDREQAVAECINGWITNDSANTRWYYAKDIGKYHITCENQYEEKVEKDCYIKNALKCSTEDEYIKTYNGSSQQIAECKGGGTLKLNGKDHNGMQTNYKSGGYKYQCVASDSNLNSNEKECNIARKKELAPQCIMPEKQYTGKSLEIATCDNGQKLKETTGGKHELKCSPRNNNYVESASTTCNITPIEVSPAISNITYDGYKHTIAYCPLNNRKEVAQLQDKVYRGIDCASEDDSGWRDSTGEATNAGSWCYRCVPNDENYQMGEKRLGVISKKTAHAGCGLCYPSNAPLKPKYYNSNPKDFGGEIGWLDVDGTNGWKIKVKGTWKELGIGAHLFKCESTDDNYADSDPYQCDINPTKLELDVLKTEATYDGNKHHFATCKDFEGFLRITDEQGEVRDLYDYEVSHGWDGITNAGTYKFQCIPKEWYRPYYVESDVLTVTIKKASPQVAVSCNTTKVNCEMKRGVGNVCLSEGPIASCTLLSGNLYGISLTLQKCNKDGTCSQSSGWVDDKMDHSYRCAVTGDNKNVEDVTTETITCSGEAGYSCNPVQIMVGNKIIGRCSIKELCRDYPNAAVCPKPF